MLLLVHEGPVVGIFKISERHVEEREAMDSDKQNKQTGECKPRRGSGQGHSIVELRYLTPATLIKSIFWALAQRYPQDDVFKRRRACGIELNARCRHLDSVRFDLVRTCRLFPWLL